MLELKLRFSGFKSNSQCADSGSSLLQVKHWEWLAIYASGAKGRGYGTEDPWLVVLMLTWLCDLRPDI